MNWPTVVNQSVMVRQTSLFIFVARYFLDVKVTVPDDYYTAAVR